MFFSLYVHLHGGKVRPTEHRHRSFSGNSSSITHNVAPSYYDFLCTILQVSRTLQFTFSRVSLPIRVSSLGSIAAGVARSRVLTLQPELDSDTL